MPGDSVARGDLPAPSGGSPARSRAFYRALGASGLAIRTKAEWDAQTLADLRELLPAGGRVLDVGCGYGRIAIPLAQAGYEVTGLDIARNLLREARRQAAIRRVALTLTEGSMTALPYPDRSFDALLCLWSAFYELTAEDEQVAALGEMDRVLRDGGVGIIEGPTYVEREHVDRGSGEPSRAEHRVVADIIAGQRMEYYAHDAASLQRVAAVAAVRRYEVLVRNWGGRPRQLLLLRP